MASPASKTDLITYCKRNLGEPVLQVNVDDEQVNNVIDDTFQFFQENCYNGMERCYLVHEITAADKTRLAATVSTSKTDGADTVTWDEATNYIPIPAHVTGISKVFGMVGNSIRSNLFGVEYRMFLNDLYAFNASLISATSALASLGILNVFVYESDLSFKSILDGSFS